MMPARRETPGASASVLARLHPLPSPRGVALEILRRSLRDDASVAELARLAQVDPALCGRLLKAANSAAQAARPVGTAQEAILRIGLRASARLALAFSLVGDHHGGPCRAFSYGAFWTGSLVRGLAAQALAVRCEVPGADEAFCAGLLAHVGRLALATAMPGPYARLLEECQDAAELRGREQAAFGIDHVALADALLEDWGFPGAMRLAVAAHPDPESVRDQGGPRVARLAHLLHAADQVAAAARRHAPVACLLVEPDGPSGAEGDGGMPAIAARLKAIVRTADTLCRFGDTEFLVVAPDTDRGEASALAARLRAAIAGPGGSTASVGIACAAFGDCAPAELVRRAEQALLASRLAGGDRASEYGARMRRVV